MRDDERIADAAEADAVGECPTIRLSPTSRRRSRRNARERRGGCADDAREVTQAEESDVRSDPTGTPRGINPMLFRQPPVPDDSADGNVEIRFKHPE
jgi:hypothetical protein